MIRKCGMEKFYNGIQSDHRGIYGDINLLHLLRGKIHQTTPVTHNTIECLESLEMETSQDFTEEHRKELEDIDKAVTKAMLTPEKKCRSTTQLHITMK
eukprot:645541-Ditylum_brightwellii.AAC.1